MKNDELIDFVEKKILDDNSAKLQAIQQRYNMHTALKMIHKIICNCAKENPARTPTLEEANDIYAWCCYGLNIGEGKGEE